MCIRDRHCKQTFISQLKSGAMGARTIDEGAMDEKSGMNFSEYMACLLYTSQAMKDCGIGTPATRASIIETLFKRGYMERCV